MNVSKRKQALLAAVSSTVCAAVWMVNCVVDVLLSLAALPQDLLLSCLWAACAMLWWLRWHSERRAAE